MSKEVFVADYLEPLLKAAGVEIASVKYAHNSPMCSFEEAVFVQFESGLEVACNVTWDSYIAIVKDCIKQLEDYL